MSLIAASLTKSSVEGVLPTTAAAPVFSPRDCAPHDLAVSTHRANRAVFFILVLLCPLRHLTPPLRRPVPAWELLGACRFLFPTQQETIMAKHETGGERAQQA